MKTVILGTEKVFKVLKMGFKVLVFKNYTVIISVLATKIKICENAHVMCTHITC